MLLEISEEITPERMKRQSQSKTTLSCGCDWWRKQRCCKEQYCLGTWNVRSMNQDKLELVKEARVNVDILGICELNGLQWVNLTQMTIISITVGKNPLEEME